MISLSKMCQLILTISKPCISKDFLALCCTWFHRIGSTPKTQFRVRFTVGAGLTDRCAGEKPVWRFFYLRKEVGNRAAAHMSKMGKWMNDGRTK